MNSHVRRILVTGATGFIGRHVLAALARTADRPVAMVRDLAAAGPVADEIETVVADLTDPSSLRGAVNGIHAVVHLAAATRTNDSAAARAVNVDGTRMLAAAAKAAGVRRFVVVSSIAVHRARLSTYAFTKREMEQIVFDSGVSSVVLRPSLVYGPGNAGLFGRVVSTVRRLPVLPVIGKGAQSMRPVHVDDLVAAILACLDAEDVAGKAFDIVGPDETTMSKLLEGIAATLGVRRRTIHVPRSLARTAVRAIAKVRKDLPFSVDNVEGADEPTPAEPLRAGLGVPEPSIRLAEGLATISDPFPPLDGGEPPVRFVVAGLGKMGLAHLTLLSAIRETAPVGAVEIDRRLSRAAERMGFRIPCFSSLDDAIEALRPDAVVIATPTDTHAALVIRAAERGVAAIVEKPLACDTTSANAAAGAVATAGITASCGYTLAYLPSFERAKELLDAGAIGPVTSFRASMEIGQVLGPKTGWMYDAARSGGGVLANVASHTLFLLHWFFGDVEAVGARTRSIHTRIDDEATVDVHFANGIRGTLETSWSVPGLSLSRTEIEVFGDNGSLRVDSERITLSLKSASDNLAAGERTIHVAELERPATFDLGGDGYCRELEEFAEAVRGGGQVRTSIARALAVQAMLEAAYASARDGGAPVPVGAPIEVVTP